MSWSLWRWTRRWTGRLLRTSLARRFFWNPQPWLLFLPPEEIFRFLDFRGIVNSSTSLSSSSESSSSENSSRAARLLSFHRVKGRTYQNRFNIHNRNYRPGNEAYDSPRQLFFSVTNPAVFCIVFFFLKFVES